jgi:hypothetical protein
VARASEPHFITHPHNSKLLRRWRSFILSLYGRSPQAVVYVNAVSPQIVHVLYIQVILLLPLLSFPPAWPYSSSPTPSLFNFRSTTLCNVFVPTIFHTRFFLNPGSAMALFPPLLRPFCFALYSPRHLSEGDISKFLLYALEFIMPVIRPTSSFPVPHKHRPRLSQLCSSVA